MGMKPPKIAVALLAAGLIRDGAASGQQEHIDAVKPAPSVTTVSNQIVLTHWYSQPDVALLSDRDEEMRPNS